MRGLMWSAAWMATFGLSLALVDPCLGADSTTVAPPPVSRRAQSRERLAMTDQRLAGFYQSIQNAGEIWIAALGKGVLQVALGPNRLGIGFWDGYRFRGVWRPSGDPAVTAETYGEIRFESVSPDTLRAQIWTPGNQRPDVENWVRSARVDTMPTRTPPPAVVGPPGSKPDPKLGDYVQVDELPEAVTKVAPVYPDAARKAGVDGTVTLQALVGADGRVKDTQVMTSIPLLDAAAVECVRQWVFKPATAQGEPVAVWVAVPVKFSLR